MQTSHKLSKILLALTFMFALAAMALAQQVPNAGTTNAPSDQKPGSLLFYNLYTSSLADASENTRFNLTNTHPSKAVTVHVFFVRKLDCTIADIYFCLTANHTVTFLASEYDPGEIGFVYLVATNTAGVPISHNYLVGDEFVKGFLGTNTYFQANLGAEAFAARLLYDGAGGPATPWADGAVGNTYNGGLSAALAYGDYRDANNLGTAHNLYDEVPVTVAVDNFQSPADAKTLLTLHSMQGTETRAGTIGNLAGLVYNDKEKGYSYQINGWGCVDARIIDPSLIRVPSGLTTGVVPSGRSGWLWMNINNGTTLKLGILGATITSNPNQAFDRKAFNGGHNLHFLKTAAMNGFAIPVMENTGCVTF